MPKQPGRRRPHVAGRDCARDTAICSRTLSDLGGTGGRCRLRACAHATCADAQAGVTPVRNGICCRLPEKLRSRPEEPAGMPGTMARAGALLRTMAQVRLKCVLAKPILALGWLLLVGCDVASGQTRCQGIHVTILNIRNNIGTVDCALFDAPEGFPFDVLHFAMRLMVMKVRNTDARCDFENI